MRKCVSPPFSSSLIVIRRLSFVHCNFFAVQRCNWVKITCLTDDKCPEVHFYFIALRFRYKTKCDQLNTWGTMLSITGKLWPNQRDPWKWQICDNIRALPFHKWRDDASWWFFSSFSFLFTELTVYAAHLNNFIIRIFDDRSFCMVFIDLFFEWNIAICFGTNKSIGKI